MALNHPLIGADLPTLTTLVAIADPNEAAILEAAGRLAARRMAEVEQARLALEGSPQVGKDFPTMLSTPGVVLPTDLARALLVLDPLAVKEIVGSGLTDGPLEESARHWQSELDRAVKEPCLDLAVWWARRFAWTRLRHPAYRLANGRLSYALGFEGLEALAEFASDFQEGLYTRAEMGARFWDNLGQQDRGLPPYDPLLVPSAYLDRHGGLAALDRVLSVAPAVVVSSTDNGHSALLDAWISRINLGSGPSALQGFQVADRRFHFGEMHRDVPHPEALLHSGISWDARLVLIATDEASSASGELARETAEDVTRWLSSANTNPTRTRVILSMADADRERLTELVPSAASLAVVLVPPIVPRDRVFIWAAQLPRLEDRPGFNETDATCALAVAFHAFEAHQADEHWLEACEADYFRLARRARGGELDDPRGPWAPLPSWRRIVRAARSGRGVRRDDAIRLEAVATLDAVREIVAFADSLPGGAPAR